MYLDSIFDQSPCNSYPFSPTLLFKDTFQNRFFFFFWQQGPFSFIIYIYVLRLFHSFCTLLLQLFTYFATELAATVFSYTSCSMTDDTWKSVQVLSRNFVHYMQDNVNQFFDRLTDSEKPVHYIGDRYIGLSTSSPATQGMCMCNVQCCCFFAYCPSRSCDLSKCCSQCSCNEGAQGSSVFGLSGRVLSIYTSKRF